MIKEKVECDYSIIDNELIIERVFVEKENRNNMYASTFLRKLEKVAIENNCKIILVPADLSKMSISFWIKNGFNTEKVEDKDKLNFVLSSKKSRNYIFDIDNNSIVVLHKNI